MDIESTLIAHLMNYPENLPEAIGYIDGKQKFFITELPSKIYNVLCKLNAEHKLITFQTLSIALSADKTIGHRAPVIVAEMSSARSGLSSDFHAIIFRALEVYLTREIVNINQTIVRSVKDGEHPLAIIDQIQKSIADLNQSVAFNTSRPLGKLLDETMQNIIANFDAQTQPGLSTGFDSLNKIHGAFMPGTLCVLAARPAMGKTALAMALATNVATRAGSVLFFSIEMSWMELCARILSAEAMVQNNYILKNAARLTMDEISKLGKSADRLRPLNLNIVDEANMTINKIRSHVQKRRPDFVVVDYLQIITPVDKHQAADTNKFFEELTRDLKIVAKEFNVCILLLSQLNRAVEGRADKRPMLSDLRSSGGIEQNADSVMFIHRPYYYDKEAEIDLAEVIVAKNRNGAVGLCELKFLDVFTKFADINLLNQMSVNHPYKE